MTYTMRDVPTQIATNVNVMPMNILRQDENQDNPAVDIALDKL